MKSRPVVSRRARLRFWAVVMTLISVGGLVWLILLMAWFGDAHSVSNGIVLEIGGSVLGFELGGAITGVMWVTVWKDRVT